MLYVPSRTQIRSPHEAAAYAAAIVVKSPPEGATIASGEGVGVGVAVGVAVGVGVEFPFAPPQSGEQQKTHWVTSARNSSFQRAMAKAASKTSINTRDGLRFIHLSARYNSRMCAYRRSVIRYRYARFYFDVLPYHGRKRYPPVRIAVGRESRR